MSKEAIKKIEASVRKLHGGERDQAAKYADYIAWRERENAVIADAVKRMANMKAFQ